MKTLRDRLKEALDLVIVVGKVRIRRVSDHKEFFTVRDEPTEPCVVFDYHSSGKDVIERCFENRPPHEDLVTLCSEGNPYEVFSVDMTSTDWELHPNDKRKIQNRLNKVMAELSE